MLLPPVKILWREPHLLRALGETRHGFYLPADRCPACPSSQGGQPAVYRRRFGIPRQQPALVLAQVRGRQTLGSESLAVRRLVTASKKRHVPRVTGDSQWGKILVVKVFLEIIREKSRADLSSSRIVLRIFLGINRVLGRVVMPQDSIIRNTMRIVLRIISDFTMQ